MKRSLPMILYVTVVTNVFSLQVVDMPLDNKDCKNGVTHRSWDEAWELRKTREPECQVSSIRFVMLHYTVCPSVESTYVAYNNNGVSAHFTLGNDGTAYRSVNPKKFIAFHAGPSVFAGFTSLNYYSIGLEHVNPGFLSDCKEVSGFGGPIQICGDLRWWFRFSCEQFLASVQLTAVLQKKYRIPVYNVITHADAAIGRKSDIGPMWNHRSSAEEYGVGYWYSESHSIDLYKFGSITDEDYIAFIRAFGYASSDPGQLIKAYQLHYVQTDISGELTTITKECILKHVVGLKGFICPITGERFDYFESAAQQWFDTNQDKAAPFLEYFGV